MSITLFIHILAGGLGVFFGYIALYSAKGASIHRKSGILFVYSMLTVSTLGLGISIVRGVALAVNVSTALLTAYLVVTALVTVRPASAYRRSAHAAGMLLALVVGLTSLTFAVQAFANGGKRNGVPAFAFVMFAVVGLSGALGDFRVLRSGPLQGASRLARHLWRMCFALFIAALSLPRVIPEAFRVGPVLALPPLAVLITLFYWLWRVRRRRTSRTVVAVVNTPAVV